MSDRLEENGFSVIERYADTLNFLPEHREKIDAMRYFLARRLFLYGKHSRFDPESQWMQVKLRIRWTLKQILFGLRSKHSFYQKSAERRAVLSNAYFSFNALLGENYNIDAVSPVWEQRGDRSYLFERKLFQLAKEIYLKLNFADFRTLFHEDFFALLDEFKKEYAKVILAYDFKALFLPNDMGVFENLSVQVFRELKRPSFLLLHGIPGIISPIDNQRTDYLLVFGDALKTNFVNYGYNPQKIFVTGHPNYKHYPLQSEIRNDLSNVLVITRTLIGSLYSHEALAVDSRALNIEYILMVEKVLRKLGVKSARLRPHPGENAQWYEQYLGSSFFSIDQSDLRQSLSQTSLVIGPSSSVFFDALFQNVNYLVFDPDISRGIFKRLDLVPPFDGSVKEVGASFHESELEERLQNKWCADIEVCRQFVRIPFQIDEITNLF